MCICIDCVVLEDVECDGKRENEKRVWMRKCERCVYRLVYRCCDGGDE